MERRKVTDSQQDSNFDITARRIAFYEDLAHKINQFGYTVMGIFPDENDPDFIPFHYTVGCAIHGGYEYSIAGLNSNSSSDILHSVYEKLLDGWRPLNEECYSDFANTPIKFQLMFGNHEANVARHYWKNSEASFRVMQLIWPDTQGRFPGEDGFEQQFLQKQMIEGSPLSITWS